MVQLPSMFVLDDLRSGSLVQVLPGHLTAGCTFPFAHAAVISSRRHGLDEEAAAEAKVAADMEAMLRHVEAMEAASILVVENLDRMSEVAMKEPALLCHE